MGYKRTGRPNGRPPGTGHSRYLDDVISATPAGDPVTVFDRIVSMCRLGLPFEQACAATGVPRVTAFDWQKAGAKAARDVLNHRRKQAQLTIHEERCWAFNDAVDQARATAALDRLAIVDQLARGGQLVETITRKVGPDGTTLLEETTKQEWRQPNLNAATWLLEKGFPEQFGRQRIEVSGPDGGPIEVSPREFILERLGIVEARLTGRPLESVPKAIDATSTEVVDNELDPDNFDA